MFTLDEVKTALNATRQGEDVRFHAVSIDSRTIEAGELFIAIEGPNFDGHRFVEEAAQKGAVAAIVRQYQACDLPQLVVSDTRVALGQLAALRRQQLSIPILAMTGSCGKTTTKAMMASILSHCGAVHAGKRSFNNCYGMPLTLLGITDEHQFAVIEMGANHGGEIEYLTQIARPTVAGITIAAPVHLEGFGDLGGVAKGKGEIFSGLTEDGVAIINADDQYASFWRSLAEPHRVIQFGLSHEADIRADSIKIDAQSQPNFTLVTPEGEIDIALPLLGEHNITNALAAAAATYAVGANLNAIKLGLEMVTPVSKRMEKRKGIGGIEIFDDSYNANPVGVEAALKVLASEPGEKILVLGEMGELGSYAEQYHRQLGQTALKYGIAKLFAVGGFTRYTVEEFGTGGEFFDKQEQLIQQLQQALASAEQQACVLVKGSRSMRMEQVVEALMPDVVSKETSE